MFSKINTAVCCGVEGKMVNVETNITSGLPNMNIVGLASTTILESRERIRAAVINSGFDYPRGRITVNLTPADLRKTGSHLDLPIALGILVSELSTDSFKAEEYGVIGELSLDGDVLGVNGVLPMVICMYEHGLRKIIVPRSNYEEASLVSGARIIPIDSLRNCVEIINGIDQPDIPSGISLKQVSNPLGLDFSDIRGQENAKRAITIAVTGRHGLIMMGTPGCGKSMLAKRIPTIMPPMNEKEIIETAIVYSVAGKNNLNGGVLIDRPFRSPNNTIGKAGLLGGGGGYPVPGEISLANNGVLFLDEVCEFDRDNIESLRTPLEEKEISHFRNGQQYKFPCNFQLIMAANPCKCGYFGDPEHLCKCSQLQIEQYQRKLSGPMMDRIDIRVQMEKLSFGQISGNEFKGSSSADMRNDVIKGMSFAREMGRTNINSNIKDADIEKYCCLGESEKKLMKAAYNSLHLSPRSYNKVLKVARTIADIDQSTNIKEEHLTEALSYRVLNYENGE